MTSSERRRAPRVQANFPIQLASGDRAASAAILRDVSEIGLRCVFSSALEEMTQVRIGLELPGHDGEPIEVEGAIVRCDKLPPATGAPNAWDIAIYFTKIDPESSRRLSAWIGRQQAASDELASRESGA